MLAFVMLNSFQRIHNIKALYSWMLKFSLSGALLLFMFVNGSIYHCTYSLKRCCRFYCLQLVGDIASVVTN